MLTWLQPLSFNGWMGTSGVDVTRMLMLVVDVAQDRHPLRLGLFRGLGGGATPIQVVDHTLLPELNGLTVLLLSQVIQLLLKTLFKEQGRYLAFS